MMGPGFDNPFFRREKYWGEPPRRIFALLDQIEDETLFYDAVDADWFETAVPDEISSGTWAERAGEAPLSVLALDRRSWAPWDPGADPAGEDEDAPAARQWIEMELGAGPMEGRLYLNLFGEAQPIGIARARPVAEPIAGRLDLAFDLSTMSADEEQLEERLQRIGHPIDWVCVYDVGQGSANGICDGLGMPLAYFDLGGGVLANSGTFPAALTGLCCTHQPAVILSHWDWDHWSSGARFPAALGLDWIVPDQKLGAVHASFAVSVAAAGRLLVWPAGLTQVRAGQLCIQTCTGTSGRNHTGLAVQVHGPNGEDPILLTGDARYTAIPSGLKAVTSVVVPHHGADMRNRSTPICPAHAASRAAYSYGPGNSFSHPRQRTFDNHHGNGWAHRSHQPAGTVDLHTADRPAGRPGHIGLCWDPALPLPRLPCGGRCTLQPVQR